WNDASGACAASTAGGPAALFLMLPGLELTGYGKSFRGTRAGSRRWDTGSAATRKSVRATSPGSVYSQRCSATCAGRPADTASAARPKPKLAHLHHGHDR